MQSKFTKVIFLIFIILGLTVPFSFLTHSQNQVLANEDTINQNLTSEEPLPPESFLTGRTKGIGTYFEIKDSEYLNIVLKSTEEIKVVLESIPRMISINISSSTDSTSTNLTISGLEPNKTYYKYEDRYKNEAVFVSDENGSYSWIQDLTQPHHIWFQEIKGTIFLPDQCLTYGSWNATTSTCILNQDLNEGVEITADNIILDCNGHTISGPGKVWMDWKSSVGIIIGRTNITLRNCVITDFYYGIYISGNQNNISNNKIINTNLAISLDYADSNRITNNIIKNNSYDGIHIWNSVNNLLKNNEITNNGTGITDWGCMNSFSSNIINFNSGIGIYLMAWPGGWSFGYKINNNDISNNNYGIYIANVFDGSVLNNNITSNKYGIYLQGIYEIYLGEYYMDWKASNNTIAENRISGNEHGIYFRDLTENNKIYHNNLIGNIIQALNEGSNNLFDNSYPSGGNYWSDYAGVDEKSGLNQDQPGSDEIGDTPYTFTGGQDRYPFMKESGWEAPPPEIPTEFWIEVKEDGECIYQNEELTQKLKCLPQGWILKIPNPEKKTWEQIATITQIEDVTDGISGWTNKDFLNYNPNTQEEWKEETEKLDPSKNPGEGGTVPVILEAVNNYYNNEEGIPADFRFEKELKRGAYDKEVKYLQMILKEEGVFPKDEIAIFNFGPLTEQAVKDFQVNYGIYTKENANGIVDKPTQDKLNQFLEQGKYNSLIIHSPLFYISNDKKNYLAIFKNITFPIELILGVIAQETGGATYKFDNEIVSPTPCGRGIMQIDRPPKYVGNGSGLQCYKNNTIDYCGKVEEGYDCLGNTLDCRGYYTNTPQGVYANIKDGLRALQEKYVNRCCYDTKECENAKEGEEKTIQINTTTSFNVICGKCLSGEKSYNSKLNYISGKYNEKPVTIFCNEFKIIDTIWRYNGRGFVRNYLRDVGGKLDELSDNNYFGENYKDYLNITLPEDEIDNWVGKLKWTDSHRKQIIKIHSPGELQVYDSQGRVTGIINGEIKEDIPFSIYDREINGILIPFSYDSYRYKIKGIEDGKYGLDIISIENEISTEFSAINIPILTNAIHQYQIDWDKLSEGEKGVILQIDSEGDGIFERAVTADNDLTYDEFILQTETVVDFDPDVLNLKSKGQFVTAYIELPLGFDVNQIDIASILLNDSVPALAKPTKIGDYDNDGIPDLMVKFEREKVKSILNLGEKVPIIVTGKLFHNGKYLDFKGDDIIRVIK